MNRADLDFAIESALQSLANLLAVTIGLNERRRDTKRDHDQQGQRSE